MVIGNVIEFGFAHSPFFIQNKLQFQIYILLLSLKMGLIYFDSESLYLESCKGNAAKIAAIDAIIDALLLKTVDVVGNADIKEYSLNDGQSIVRTTYASVNDIYSAIANFEKIKQIYVNRVNGRMTRLMDGANFNRRNYGR